MFRVGQNRTDIHTRCVYGITGRDLIYTYGHVWRIYTVLANPKHVCMW